MTAIGPDNSRIIGVIRQEIARTGKRYQIALETLDPQSLRELYRLLRDLEFEQRAAVTRAIRQPWRR